MVIKNSNQPFSLPAFSGTLLVDTGIRCRTVDSAGDTVTFNGRTFFCAIYGSVSTGISVSLNSGGLRVPPNVFIWQIKIKTYCFSYKIRF